MTVISFRAYRLGYRETITDEALHRMAGQVFVFRDDDRSIAASVISAAVRDGWIVITSNVNADDFTTQIAEAYTVGPINVHVLPDIPDRIVPTPTEPDWASATGSIGPARLQQTLAAGLRKVAAERWWFDSCCDSNGEWLLGPEYRWESP